MTATKPKMTFNSPAFAKAAESLNSRATNLDTANQRSSTIGMNDFNKSQRSAADTSNYALSTNPLVQRSMAEDNRNFTEDSRRFDKGLGFKDTADQRANDTNRFQSSNALEGSKYNADAGVKSTQIGADAQRYGADRNLEGNKYNADTSLAGTRLQTDASRYGADRNAQSNMYGADKGYQASIYNADRGVDQANISANASRFSALLGAGTATLNSQQYRPTFNR